MSFLNPYAFLFLFLLLYMYKKTQRATPLFFSIIFLVIAFSRPVLTKSLSDQAIDAKKFIIAFDISSSMSATDLTPNRVEIEKELITKILKTDKNSNISLFAFTSNALILSPFTTDHKLLISALNSINIKNVLTKSTDILSLLKKIAKLKTSNKNLIIFSDGGDYIDIKQALKIAKKANITIYGVAMATKKGTTIKDDYGKFIKDNSNHLVITRLNPEFKTLCIESGGEFFSYDTLTPSLTFLQTKHLSKKTNLSYIELFYTPLFIALVLFILHFIQILKKILLLVPFLSSYLFGGVFDWYYINKANDAYIKKEYKLASKYYEYIRHKTMQSQLNLANSYYQNNSFKQAYNIYKNLRSKDLKIKQLILYKQANCEVMLKKYDLAKIHYQKALNLKKDDDIAYNLKLIIKKHTKRRDYPAAKTKKQSDKAAPKGKNNTKNQKSKSGKKSQIRGSKSSSSNSKNIKNKNKNKNSNSLSHPLGYKAYDTINKGYINEKKPW